MPRPSSTVVIAMAVTVLGSCGSEVEQSPMSAEWHPASEAMPSLRLVHASTDIILSPPSLRTRMAISESGEVLMSADDSLPQRMVILDTMGQAIERFGRQGEGPGELVGAWPVGLTRDAAMIFEFSKLLFTSFTRQGGVLRTVRPRTARMTPVAMLSDTTVLIAISGERTLVQSMAIINLTSGDHRTIDLRGDLPDEFEPDLTRPIDQILPGNWAGGPLTGVGDSYHLALYDWDGNLVRVLHRDVAPPMRSRAKVDREMAAFVVSIPGRRRTPAEHEKVRRELTTEPLNHFSGWSNPSVDGADRLWVLGISGDSAYADVFSPDRFLGRIEIGCRDFDDAWAIRGEWLALACASPDPSYSGDAILQLYHIE